MRPQQTPTEIKEAAVQRCDMHPFPYDNAGFSDALKTTVWRNKQVVFSCIFFFFWQVETFR